MSESAAPAPPEAPGKARRWFIILAVVTLIGFALFVGVITVCSLRIPELKKAKYGVLEDRKGDRAS
jgi:hypothetical protein